MAPSPSSSSDRVLDPVAAVLAWLWPGLGHISIGQRQRGLRIMFGMLLLVLGGLLVGGLDCVDRKHDRLWFLAQSLCGPIAFVADIANQSLVQGQADEWSGEELRLAYVDEDSGFLEAQRRVAIGRVNEMGTLFIALAGLMNAVVILDVLYRPSSVDSAPTESKTRRREDQP